jgi:hypothetical protein
MSDTADAMEVFERTVIAMCRERGHQRYTPKEIDETVRRAVDDFAGSLEELADYIEREDWDALEMLAKQTQTLRLMGRRI